MSPAFLVILFVSENIGGWGEMTVKIHQIEVTKNSIFY
jgi:hypothetical protein